MSWEKVDEPGQFPTVAVYKREGRNGAPVYRIAFCNCEYPTTLQTNLVGITMAALVLTSFWGFFAIHFSSLFIGMGVAMAFAFYFWEPWQINRAVELDYGEDLFRSLKKDTEEVARRLQWLHNLTVQEHPDVEYGRMRRLEKGEKLLSKEEKQHCLIGWFGEGGAEQIILCFRVEWPSRNSLMEVQQAILWARQEAAGLHAPQLAKQGHIGIKPDLD